MEEKGSGRIVHKGKVIGVEGNFVDVAVVAESGCASCHARKACGAGDSKEKVITVATPYASRYRTGEEVRVSIRRSMGIKAVFIVYIIPLIVVFIALSAMIGQGVPEVVSGCLSLVVLGVYYLFIGLLRHKIEKDINFEIEKLNNNLIE